MALSVAFYCFNIFTVLYCCVVYCFVTGLAVQYVQYVHEFRNYLDIICMQFEIVIMMVMMMVAITKTPASRNTRACIIHACTCLLSVRLITKSSDELFARKGYLQCIHFRCDVSFLQWTCLDSELIVLSSMISYCKSICSEIVSLDFSVIFFTKYCISFISCIISCMSAI